MPRMKDILDQRRRYSAETGQTVADVAAKMAGLNIGAILVLEGGRLKGLFSERDLMKRVIVPGLDPARTPVEQVMSTDLTRAGESTTVEEAMELMRRCNCRHLPVLRGDEVLGMISMRDLMMYELDRKTKEIEHMKNYIQSA